jgi:amino acid permease
LLAGLCIGALYWIWCLVLLNAVNQSGVILNEDQFITQLGSIAHSSQVLHPIAWFSLLAMWTSCLGMSLGTQHYLKDLFTKFRYLPFSLSLLNIFPSLVLLFCTQGAYRQLLTMASFLALYLLVFLPTLLLILQDRRQKKIHCSAIVLLGLSVGLIIAVWP